MDNALIFNVKLTTLLTGLAFSLTLVAFAIAACFETGSLKVLDFGFVDTNVLDHPIISDRTYSYIGRITSDVRLLNIIVDATCTSGLADGKYQGACTKFEKTFGILEGTIVSRASGAAQLASLEGHCKVMTTLFTLTILALAAATTLGAVRLYKFKRSVQLWVLANWSGGLSASFLIAFAVVLASFRGLVKELIWDYVPKSYPYILIKNDTLDSVCWASASLSGMAAMIFYLNGIGQCIPVTQIGGTLGSEETLLKQLEAGGSVAVPIRSDVLRADDTLQRTGVRGDSGGDSSGVWETPRGSVRGIRSDAAGWAAGVSRAQSQLQETASRRASSGMQTENAHARSADDLRYCQVE